jgi:hypothetical protein
MHIQEVVNSINPSFSALTDALGEEDGHLQGHCPPQLLMVAEAVQCLAGCRASKQGLRWQRRQYREYNLITEDLQAP